MILADDGIYYLQQKLREFAEERNWSKYHTPENLAKSISIEAAELLECYQWSNNADVDKIDEEVADVFIYLLMLVDKLGIDLVTTTLNKIKTNETKYPISKAYNNAKKYTEL